MTREDFKKWNTAGLTGTCPDELNPAFIFHMTAIELLCKIAKGEINAQELAKRQLEANGFNIDGQWAGFKHEIE